MGARHHCPDLKLNPWTLRTWKQRWNTLSHQPDSWRTNTKTGRRSTSLCEAWGCVSVWEAAYWPLSRSIIYWWRVVSCQNTWKRDSGLLSKCLGEVWIRRIRCSSESGYSHQVPTVHRVLTLHPNEKTDAFGFDLWPFACHVGETKRKRTELQVK